jgi:hypothetical protein
MLLVTALHTAAATLPLAAAVKMTHMLTVVGKQVVMSIPSNNGRGSTFRNTTLDNGTPTPMGHARNKMACMSMFNGRFVMALVNWDNSNESPVRRKMNETP